MPQDMVWLMPSTTPRRRRPNGLSRPTHKAYTSLAFRVFGRDVPARRDRAAGERRSEGSLSMPYAFTPNP